MSESEVAAKSRQKAGASRGDLFQDIIGGICILTVLFGDSESVKIEAAYDDDDRFDDVVLETGSETICIQVKHSPDYRLLQIDLNDRSGRLNVEKMVKSAQARQEGDAGSRFIVLTSYNEPRPSEIQLSDKTETLSLFGDFEFNTRTIQGSAGTVSENSEIEFIFDVPYLGQGIGVDTEYKLSKTKVFQEILQSVQPIFGEKENPRIGSAETLVKRAISLAQRVREDPGDELTRPAIADRLEVSPSAEEIPQNFPVDEDCIIPSWVHNLQGTLVSPGDRRLIEGDPGSGKSTGIELLSDGVTEQENVQTIRYYLHDPTDTPEQKRDRIDPNWFRNQLAAELQRKFPEAFSPDEYPIWTGTEKLQEHIDTVAKWADEHHQQGLIIIDGLDHALPHSEGMNSFDDIKGTVIEEIGNLTFPDPLGLLMVGRELSSDGRDVLKIDDRQVVPYWTKNEVGTYYEQNGIDIESELLSSVYDVSEGLPVILSHLLRTAEEEGDRKEGLRNAVADAPEVHGKLEEYYEELWDPTTPRSRDVLSLIAVSQTALESEHVHRILDLPWLQNQTRLDSGVLAHTLEETKPDRYRIFHASFREFVEGALSDDERKSIHQSFCDYYLDQFEKAPDYPTRLRYHAQRGPGLQVLQGLATQDNVLEWWRQGVHIDEIIDALELAFDGAVEEADYFSLLDSIMLGTTANEMLSIYADERLEYFLAIRDEERAIKYLNRIRKNAPGSGSVLEAMQSVSQVWEDKLEPEWLMEWIEEQEGEEHSFDWNPEAYFETAARLLDSDDFWIHAREIVTEGAEEHFTYQVFRGIRENLHHLKNRPSPPEWLFDNPEKTLEAAETIGHHLPNQWQTRFIDEVKSYDDLSPVALHTILVCGAPEHRVEAGLENISFGEPRNQNESYPRFTDAYYVGAILADMGRTPEAVRDAITELADEQPRIRELVAVIGAATTRRSIEMTRRWADAALEILTEILDNHELADPEPQNLERSEYQSILQDTIYEFNEVVEYGSEDLLNRVFSLADSEAYDSFLLNNFARDILRARDEVFDNEELPDVWEEEFRNIMTAPPEGEPPTRELMDLALRAAESDHTKLAEKYYRKAVERSFRYGYHKDRFLGDVWDGLEVIVEDWESHLGTSIQLSNWAVLLHSLTDGDETGHLEYEFLSTLLEEDVIDYSDVASTVTDRGTARRIWRWRLRNPNGITKSELHELIYIQEKWIESSGYSNQYVQYFANAAQIAVQRNWHDEAKYALWSMNKGDFVRDGVDESQATEIQRLADEYGVEIPEDIVADDDGSEGYDSSPDEKPASLSKEIHQILLKHSYDDPVTKHEFEDQPTDDIINAGRAIVNNLGYRPTAAVPIAETLVDRGEQEIAISLLKETIAEKRLLSWHSYGRGRLEELGRVLLELQGDEALQTVLSAWQESFLDTKTNQCIFPQLVWVVKETEGKVAAEELVSYSVRWLSRLFSPHEDYVQQWGNLSSPDIV
ncbi:hypothetical protein RBH20_20885 [Haloarcula sp. H-GB4]|uniref:hypothetical protein n=1 Tax=Haloarcula sp. H-GB4 TaxID=3069755 RepID=UPI0027B27A0E|nr:hypothetical protein [Haloarcula sp. H-GB4]MDQ2074979.1 hypothetical protein [Haloarcula sp. H-GB4]